MLLEEQEQEQGQEPMHEHDMHWKLVIETLFKDFAAFFLPDFYDQIDFNFKPESIEKEFHRLIYGERNNKGKLYSDKLIKVRLKNGADRYVLIHIEVQSGRDLTIPKRMFQYFYRIRDKYKQDVTAIAIYTNKGSVPPVYDRYEYNCGKTRLVYHFDTYRAHIPDPERLKKDQNPFALLILACQYLNLTMKNRELRVTLKLKLLELAKERNYTGIQIEGLLTFIEFMLILPKNLQADYEQKIAKLYIKTMGMQASDIQKRMISNIYKHFHGESVDERTERTFREKERALREEERVLREQALREQERIFREEERVLREQALREQERIFREEERVLREQALREQERIFREEERTFREEERTLREEERALREEERTLSEQKQTKSVRQFLVLEMTPEAIAKLLEISLERVLEIQNEIH